MGGIAPAHPEIAEQRRDPMLRSDASSVAVGVPPRFVLYVEGPRDREILQIWARRVSPGWLAPSNLPVSFWAGVSPRVPSNTSAR